MALTEVAATCAVDRADLDRLLALQHPDPHSILGAHPAHDLVTVRAYRPDAVRVYLLYDRAGRVEMEQLDHGIFEAIVPDCREVFPYRLEIHRDDGAVIIL